MHHSNDGGKTNHSTTITEVDACNTAHCLRPAAYANGAAGTNVAIIVCCRRFHSRPRQRDGEEGREQQGAHVRLLSEWCDVLSRVRAVTGFKVDTCVRDNALVLLR